MWMAGLLREKVPVLVYGAGDGGEVVVRECRQNPHVNYQPIGFLDDDPRKRGTAVLGLPIFGGADSLPEILEKTNIQGCIISSGSILKNGHSQEIRTLCDKRGLWIKQLRLDFIQEGIGEAGEHFYLRRSQSSILDSWD
jgi:UDP-GlcNAc:undecaprenyl-phosphate GlcNAc-1-phosphate transferase